MSQTTLKRPLSFAALVVVVAVLAVAPGTHAGEWEWEIAPYIWFTDVGVDVSLNETDIAGTTIDTAKTSPTAGCGRSAAMWVPGTPI